MQKLVSIVLMTIINTLAFGQNKRVYQYLNNIPTRYGIQHYIDLNQNHIIKTVENFIGDSIFSYNIKAENLSEYVNSDSIEAGRFYPDNEIVITNELKYYDYELNFVPKWRQKEFNYNTKFVKGVLIHELIHLYIYQFINVCSDNNLPVNSEYNYFNMFPFKKHYASEFIEEGICEYVVMKLKEGIFSNYELDCLGGNAVNVRNFIQNQNTFDTKYLYSRSFVKKIFETNSFRTALLVIVTCEPPSYDELLCPDRYYNRLLKHAEDINCNDFSLSAR